MNTLAGVGPGAFLNRRNDKRARADRLLVDSLNDAVASIAEVAADVGGREAQARYAPAVSRIAVHGSPAVVTAFRRFQDGTTTVTDEGRARLLDAVQAARRELGHKSASSADVAVLLFGPQAGRSRLASLARSGAATG